MRRPLERLAELRGGDGDQGVGAFRKIAAMHRCDAVLRHDVVDMRARRW